MPKSAPTVFVVDDEVVIAETLATILLTHGYSAIPFMDPLQALNYTKIRLPDLLVTDVRMPQMSGIELGIEIRKICPGCRVLLFSGHASSASILKDKRIAEMNFTLLAKPVHPKDLLLKINSLME